MNSERLFPVEQCWVLDSSAIIEFKSLITPEIETKVLTLLDQLVLQGKISFPRQVKIEVSGDGQDDLPAQWVLQNYSKIICNKSPEEHYVKEVLSKFPNLVEEDNMRDAADPYVLALVLQLQNNGFDANLVSEDRVDRPPKKISLQSACQEMSVEFIRTAAFLESIGIDRIEKD